VSRATEMVADVEYAAAWRLVGAVPAGLAHGAFRLGADLAARRGGGGARRLRANLARAVPAASPARLDELVRAGLRSYARYWCEAFRLPRMDPLDIYRRTDPQVSGTDPFFEALRAGRGVIFALPHSGNWDAAGVWLVQTLCRLGHEPAFTTVAQRLRPESLYRRFVDYRAGLGFEVVAVEDGRAAHRALTGRLRAGGVVCLLADRDLTGSGVEVELFGEPALFPTGPALLAVLTGAVLIPVFPGFTADGWSVRMAEPVPVAGRRDVPAATQAVADAFAQLIAEAPADWHALQPVWTADRSVRDPVTADVLPPAEAAS
jgi:phosphatidylinositol dimannoside acyltransferase